MAGRIERRAKIIRTNTEFQETASPAVVSWHSVVPALIATKEGVQHLKWKVKTYIKKTINSREKLKFCVYKKLLVRIQ